MYNEQEILFNLIDNILSFDDYNLKELHHILKKTHFFYHLSLSNLDYQLTLMEQNGEIGSFQSLEHKIEKITKYYCKVRDKNLKWWNLRVDLFLLFFIKIIIFLLNSISFLFTSQLHSIMKSGVLFKVSMIQFKRSPGYFRNSWTILFRV